MSQSGMARGSVNRMRPGVYRLRVDAGPDPATGKRRQVSKVVHGSKSEADSALTGLLREVESGFSSNAKTTVAELLSEWLDLKRRSLSPKSIEMYEGRMRNDIVPVIGKRAVSSLSARDLDSFYTALEKAGRSKYVIRQIHATVRAALTQAVKWQIVEKNVAFSASVTQPPKRVMRPISRDELASILSATNGRYGATLGRFFLLAALTGARRGELLGLRRDDLDLAESRLHIVRSVVAAGGELFVKSTKTGQVRTIALDNLSVSALLAQYDALADQAQRAGFDLVENPYLFASDPTGSKSLYPDWPTHVFRKVCDSLSLAYHLHELRHFSATQLIAAGVDVRTVSGRLGHSDPSITLRVYSHLLKAKDQEAANILGRIVDLGDGR